MAYRYRKSSFKKYRTFILMAGVAIMIAAVLLSVQKDLSELPEEPEARALAIAEQDSNVLAFKRAYPNAIFRINKLEPYQIENMAKDYPVVYGDLPEKTLYEIHYTAGETGIFLIVDTEKGEVLKTFETARQLL